MTETYKVYTSYPSEPSHQQPHFERGHQQNPMWGFWFMVLIGGLFVVLWAAYRVMDWWDNMGLGYTPPNKANKYHNYPKDTGIVQGANNTTLAKPAAKKWAGNLYKPKPIVPPKVFVAGRMNGVDYQEEGEPEAKYLMEYERNRYFAQNDVSIPKQRKIEAKWEKDAFNGT